MPAASTPAPSRSGNRPTAGSRLSSSTRAATAIVTSPIGRLTRNTQCQLSCTSTPPSGGPAAAATAPLADQIATARGRWGAANSTSTSARDVGNSAAAPTACATRAATSQPTDGAAAHRPEAATNTSAPAMKTRLRPRRSASRPAGTSSAANTIAYALSTHDSDASLAPPKLAWMSGNAMLTMNRSRLAMNVATHATTSTRLRLAAGPPPGADAAAGAVTRGEPDIRRSRRRAGRPGAWRRSRGPAGHRPSRTRRRRRA